MLNRMISAEVAIEDLINTLLNDVQVKKSSQLSIDELNKDDDEVQEDWMNDPRSAEVKEANIKDYKQKIREAINRSCNTDGLDPIVILLGNSSMIKQKVIEPFKDTIKNDSHYGWDIEFKEIESNKLTKEFVSNFPRPAGKDGGVIFVGNLSRFTEMYENVNDQVQLVRDIISNRYGALSTGWRIVFIEDTSDREISFTDSFVYNWTKGVPPIWFVEE